MNEIDCSVIQDMLPLYADGTCSNATKALVRSHIESCENCKGLYELMKTEMESPSPAAKENMAAVLPLKKIKKKNIKNIAVTAVLVLVILLGAFASLAQGLGWQLIAPRYQESAKDIAQQLREALINEKIGQFTDKLDPSEQYYADCHLSEDMFLRNLKSFDTSEDNVIMIGTVAYITTNDYYRYEIACEKPTTYSALAYKDGDIKQFLLYSFTDNGDIILSEETYAMIVSDIDPNKVHVQKFEYGGKTYYHTNSAYTEYPIDVESFLNRGINWDYVPEATCELSVQLQAVRDAKVVPVEIYEVYARELDEITAICEQIEDKYIKMGETEYKRQYREKYLDILRTFADQYGEVVSCSVDSVWKVSGGHHHCWIEIGFKNGNTVMVNFGISDDCSSFYIYRITAPNEALPYLYK